MKFGAYRLLVKLRKAVGGPRNPVLTCGLELQRPVTQGLVNQKYYQMALPEVSASSFFQASCTSLTTASGIAT
jgi:hypothetical protein